MKRLEVLQHLSVILLRYSKELIFLGSTEYNSSEELTIVTKSSSKYHLRTVCTFDGTYVLSISDQFKFHRKIIFGREFDRITVNSVMNSEEQSIAIYFYRGEELESVYVMT